MHTWISCEGWLPSNEQDGVSKCGYESLASKLLDGFLFCGKKQTEMPISEPHIRSNEQIFLDAQPIQTYNYNYNI